MVRINDEQGTWPPNTKQKIQNNLQGIGDGNWLNDLNHCNTSMVLYFMFQKYMQIPATHHMKHWNLFLVFQQHLRLRYEKILVYIVMTDYVSEFVQEVFP